MKRSVLISDQTGTALRLPDLINYSEAGILSRTVLAAEGMRVVLFAFAAGQELTEHASSARALVLALQGSATFQIGDREHELRPGDLVHLPPNTPHALTAQEPFSMLLIMQRPSTARADSAAPSRGTESSSP